MRQGKVAAFLGSLLSLGILVGSVMPGDDPLLDAVRRGDAAAVALLLQEGADPDAVQDDGLTALHLAAQDGYADVAALLLRAGAEVEAKTAIGEYTPLHLAGAGAHTSVVRALLDAGAEPGAVTTTTGVTPLHLAAKALSGEGAVEALLEAGAPVDARERSAGQTALIFAAASGRAGTIRMLLSHGADPAVSTEVMDVLKRVAIDRAAEVRLRDALKGAETMSPSAVQAAIAEQRSFLRSDEQIQGVLRGFHPDSIARRAPSWNTPSGARSEVQILVRPRVETLVGKTGGMTALLHAAREGHIEAADALLNGGADIDQVAGDGSSPLLIALLNGRFDLGKHLVERGANPNRATQTDGISPLFAVLQIQWAFKFTAQPQPRAHDNQETEYMEVLHALLEAGADPNVSLRTHMAFAEYEAKSGINFTGATPFWRAAFAQDIPAMRALAAYGAEPHAPSTWPEPGLREGRQNDGRLQEDSGLPLLPEGTPNMYPIHAAAGGGYMGLGAFMVNNVPNNFLNAVKYLVEEHGADVNLPDSWGYTPLHYAAVRGGNDLIEYLVAQGADVGAISRLGQSAADMARGGNAGYFARNAYPETVELLQSLGSPLVCLSTHFRGTGDYCSGSGVEPFGTAAQGSTGVTNPFPR